MRSTRDNDPNDQKQKQNMYSIKYEIAGSGSGPRRAVDRGARRFGHVVSLLIMSLAVASDVVAQAETVVLNGRVEDESGVPLAGALVLAGDSVDAVYTDSDGIFALALPSSPSYGLSAEALGYEPTEFELGPAAPDQLSVLRLPLLSGIEGLTVVDDRGFLVLVDGLDDRRDRYPATVRTYARDELTLFGDATVREFLARTLPDAGPCEGVPQLLCRSGRYDRWEEIDPVLVCLDEAIAARGSVVLETLPLSAVARVELYPPDSGWGLVNHPFRGGQVRIYTSRWMLDQSVRSPHTLRPLRTGC